MADDDTGTRRQRTSMEEFSARVVTLVKSSHFESFMAIFILANCAVMGVQAQMVLDRKSSRGVDGLEQVWTSVFVAELILKFYAMGWRRFVPCMGTKASSGSWWYLSDALIVIVTCVIPSWILPLVGADGGDTLRVLTVLRTLRLIRVARVLRSEYFVEVWLLLRGMVDSMRMLFWTCLVIAFLTYLFAIFGVVLISPVLRDAYIEALSSASSTEADIQELAELEDKFGGMTQFMFTLTQVVTLDSWGEYTRSVMKYCPTAWIFFYLYIALGVLVLMNIVTAVLVDKALMNSMKDAEEVVKQKQRKKKEAMDHFCTLFKAMDTDGSGSLTHEEFSAGFHNKEVAMHLLALEIEPANCEEIFILLDNGDGILTLDEFFEGLRRMEGTATAKDLFRLLHKTQLISNSVNEGSADARASSRQAFEGPSDDAISRRLDALFALVVATNEKVDMCLRQGTREPWVETTAI